MALAALLFLLTAAALIAVTQSSFSYSHDGEWVRSTEPEKDCLGRFMCTPSNYTYKSDDPKFVDYNSKNACAKLISKGIKRINFHGDSFMRQIYSAMLITLSGNYRNGSLVSSTGCEFHKQFNDKKCGVHNLNHHGVVCDGEVLLDPILTGIDNLNLCLKDNKTVILWSFGNYKTTRFGRHGVNNATAYSDLFLNSPCPLIRASTNRLCSVWWVSTHYRLRAIYPDEVEDMVRNYNVGMRRFYESGSCGPVKYVDVYNMTAGLARGHRKDSESMTYDMVHWGMEVNLVKAQLLLNAILQHL